MRPADRSRDVDRDSAAPTSVPVGELIATIADPGSWHPWDQAIGRTDPPSFVDSKPYAVRLVEAARATGHHDCIQTGSAAIAGRAIGLIVVDFSFMAGSIGIAAGEQLSRAFETAAEERLPMVALAASGGTRMQEGTRAFMQMVKVTDAVREFRSRSLPYIAYLMHPTMGGTLASWGSLAHLTFAAPGATIGFSGPRVIEFMTGATLDPSVQSSENLRDRGFIDAVLSPSELRQHLQTLLVALEPNGAHVESPDLASLAGDEEAPDPWIAVSHSRDPQRPGAAQLLTRGWDNITYLAGDRAGYGDDPACITAIARLDGIPTVVIAQDRCGTSKGARMTPVGYRKARRAMGLAADLHLPVVTVVDTPGAELSEDSEEQGLSWELAKTLYELLEIASPTVSILLGEGNGGGALALMAGDRVLAAKHSWLAPLAPEAASVILFRSADRAVQLARMLGTSTFDLVRFGIVDTIVAEHPTAAVEGATFLDRVAAVTANELRGLAQMPPDERLARRRQRYRSLV